MKRVRSRKIKLHQEINDGYLEKFSYLFEENLELYMNYRYKIYSKKFEDFPSNILRGVTYAYRILIIDDFLQFLKKLGFDFSIHYNFYGSREDEICSKYFIEFSENNNIFKKKKIKDTNKQNYEKQKKLKHDDLEFVSKSDYEKKEDEKKLEEKRFMEKVDKIQDYTSKLEDEKKEVVVYTLSYLKDIILKDESLEILNKDFSDTSKIHIFLSHDIALMTRHFSTILLNEKKKNYLNYKLFFEILNNIGKYDNVKIENFDSIYSFGLNDKNNTYEQNNDYLITYLVYKQKELKRQGYNLGVKVSNMTTIINILNLDLGIKIYTPYDNDYNLNVEKSENYDEIVVCDTCSISDSNILDYDFTSNKKILILSIVLEELAYCDVQAVQNMHNTFYQLIYLINNEYILYKKCDAIPSKRINNNSEEKENYSSYKYSDFIILKEVMILDLKLQDKKVYLCTKDYECSFQAILLGVKLINLVFEKKKDSMQLESNEKTKEKSNSIKEEVKKDKELSMLKTYFFDTKKMYAFDGNDVAAVFNEKNVVQYPFYNGSHKFYQIKLNYLIAIRGMKYRIVELNKKFAKLEKIS